MATRPRRRHAQRRLSTQFGTAPATKAHTESTVVPTPMLSSSANTTTLVVSATAEPSA